RACARRHRTGELRAPNRLVAGRSRGRLRGCAGAPCGACRRTPRGPSRPHTRTQRRRGRATAAGARSHRRWDAGAGRGGPAPYGLGDHQHARDGGVDVRDDRHLPRGRRRFPRTDRGPRGRPVLAPPLAMLSLVGGFLASANLGAATRRFSSASTPLVLTVALSCTVLFSTTTLEHAIHQQRQAGLTGQLAITSSGPGVPASALSRVRDMPDVRSAVALTPTTLGPQSG